jgi:hypothetical protein
MPRLCDFCAFNQGYWAMPQYKRPSGCKQKVAQAVDDRIEFRLQYQLRLEFGLSTDPELQPRVERT